MSAIKRVKAGDVFEKFLLEDHNEDLLKILKEDGEKGHFSTVVNFLSLFEKHMEVAEGILESPKRFLDIFDNSLRKALVTLFERECKDNPALSVKSNVHIRLIEIPRCPELYLVAIPLTGDVGRLLCLSGTVIRVTALKIMESQREYACVKCKHVFIVHANYSLYYQISKPMRCPNPNGACYGTNFYASDANEKICASRDYQEIKIQEQAQKLSVGMIPRSIWVTLEDDLVDCVKPGDDVVVCGVVAQRWKSLVRGVRPDIDLTIKANNVTVRNKQRTGMVITNDVRCKFKNFWKRYKHDPLEGRNIILAAFCPQIYGLYVLKLAIAIVICGGVQRMDDYGTKTRGESHLLLVGDPGTGKSQFLKYVATIVPRCVLTTGTGTTSAGLTVSAVRDEGEWALEAGALVLADGGICCIDEFNSMKECDRAAIHEAMEQQTISVAKAGIVCKLNSRCSILAATNPKGNYDTNQPLNVNVALASPLLSRFDLILVLLDSRNADWDKMVSTYILEGRNPLATNENQDNMWSSDMLQNYFCHVRTLQPKMSGEAHDILTKYYKLQRQRDGRSQARTTIRLLESLVRLSQGHARLCMCEEVRALDAIVAITLMESSMCGTALLEAGNPLHTAFPASPREEYKKQMSLVLHKLDLVDILAGEKKRLAAEDVLLEEEALKSQEPSPRTTHDTNNTLRTTSDILALARTQSIKRRQGFLELDDTNDVEIETKKKCVKAKKEVGRFRLGLDGGIGLEDANNFPGNVLAQSQAGSFGNRNKTNDSLIVSGIDCTNSVSEDNVSNLSQNDCLDGIFDVTEHEDDFIDFTIPKTIPKTVPKTFIPNFARFGSKKSGVPKKTDPSSQVSSLESQNCSINFEFSHENVSSTFASLSQSKNASSKNETHTFLKSKYTSDFKTPEKINRASDGNQETSTYESGLIQSRGTRREEQNTFERNVNKSEDLPHFVNTFDETSQDSARFATNSSQQVLVATIPNSEINTGICDELEDHISGKIDDEISGDKNEKLRNKYRQEIFAEERLQNKDNKDNIESQGDNSLRRTVGLGALKKFAFNKLNK